MCESSQSQTRPESTLSPGPDSEPSTALLERCPACEYSLHGMPVEHRCPECGVPVDRRWVVFGKPVPIHGHLAHAGLATIYLWIIFVYVQSSNDLATLVFIVPVMLILWFVWPRHRWFIAVGERGVTVCHRPSCKYATYGWGEIVDVYVKRKGRVMIELPDRVIRISRWGGLHPKSESRRCMIWITTALEIRRARSR